MTTLEPLRAEHRELLPHVDALKDAADAVGRAPTGELGVLLHQSLAFLTGHLIPHARAEDAALYPVVEQVLGAPRATATMTREHEEVALLTGQLQQLLDRLLEGQPVDVLATELRRVLYGLHTLVRVHFAEEEEVYLPLLEERLTPDQASAVLATMHHAAGH